MLDKFTELLSRPGVPAILTGILDREEVEREREKDRERGKLRAERAAILDEIVIGRAALTCAVKEKEAAALRVRAASLKADREVRAAKNDLADFERTLQRRAGKIETELAARPISLLWWLREKLGKADHQLGAPPAWGLESLKKTPDMSWFRRAERLREIDRELNALESTDSATVERAAKHLEERIDLAIR